MPPAAPVLLLSVPHLLLVDEELDQAQEALDGKPSWLPLSLSLAGPTKKGVPVFARVRRELVQDLADIETERRWVARRRTSAGATRQNVNVSAASRLERRQSAASSQHSTMRPPVRRDTHESQSQPSFPISRLLTVLRPSAHFPARPLLSERSQSRPSLRGLHQTVLNP